MIRRKRRLFYKGVLVFLAIVGGYIGYELNYQLSWLIYEEDDLIAHGLNSEDGNTALQCPHSLIGVIEGVFDFNGDGKPDQWSVVIRENQKFMLHYHLTDTNGDGNPDSVAVDFNGFELSFRRTEDAAGTPMHRGLNLANLHKEREWVNYHDFDLDGTLDQMRVRTKIDEDSNVETQAHFVLFDDCWTLVTGVESRYEVFVRKEERDILLQFHEGKWITRDE